MDTTNMRSITPVRPPVSQLRMGVGRGPSNRNGRMADRLEAASELAEQEAEECRRAGDWPGVAAARERARSSARAAALLRGGPSGVRQAFYGAAAA